MTRMVSIPAANELPEGGRRVCDAEGTSILLLKTGGEVHAIENRCPHRGAPLTGAVLKEGCIQCPWHGLRFRVASGECVTNEKLRLKKFAVTQAGAEVAIELAGSNEEKAVAGDVRTALVRYGVTGQVGWFGTIHDLELHRGAQVVVESALGLQLGEVLVGNDGERSADPLQRELCGEIVRNAAAEDVSAHALAIRGSGPHFALIEERLKAIGHTVVEVEATLDRQLVVVWLLSAPGAELGPAAVQLADALKVRQVRFLERQSEEAASASTRYNGSGSRKEFRKEERPMKGPGLRQKHDLDRVWECPGCQHRERSTGIQTSMICPKCERNGGSRPPFMKLVASPPTAPRRTFEVFSNTPVPTPVVAILGEDAARIPKKQAMRQGRPSPAAEGAASAVTETAPLEIVLPEVEKSLAPIDELSAPPPAQDGGAPPDAH